MGRYEGLDARLKARVAERDRFRCRWCGRTNDGFDPHHIRYRRGGSDDVEENLICLCRRCHDFVHGTPNVKGEIIPKVVAQQLLWELVERPGLTGIALWRQRKHEFANQGLCEHGQFPESCYVCDKSREYAR
jgi:hypothetical protein